MSDHNEVLRLIAENKILIGAVATAAFFAAAGAFFLVQGHIKYRREELRSKNRN